MSSYWPLFIVCCVAVWSVVSSIGSIDQLKPIVKISPAKSDNVNDDYFGYSVTAHQLFEDSTGMTLEQILNQTMIMVGAPRGQYPGGLLNDVPVDRTACDQFYTPAELLTLNETQILECYNGSRTGLVYQCPLSTGTCGGTLGNGNSLSVDGLLYDRIGNAKIFSYGISAAFNDLHRIQNKNGQQMGATVYSSDGIFVACAPMWSLVGANNLLSEPRGLCVYSGRSLRDFIRLYPCNDAGVSTSQINEGFCEAGFSVTSSTTDSITSNNVTVDKTVLLTGVPGRQYSTGGAFFYSSVGKDITALDLIDKSLITQYPTVNASLGNTTDDEKRKKFHTVPDNRFSYYGYAMSSGFITNRNIKDFVITSPRYTQYTQMGRVYIVNTIDTVPTLYVEGKQFGEYFGYSVATADLNNDGWDDIIVGAPIYGKNFEQETGRIFIFWNMEGGGFNESAIIVGTGNGGRFGSSITSLGDLNNDGYEDIAVGAPFEGSGVVYIYHGQSMDKEGSIINKTYQQRIDGASFVSQVSNLTSVSGFGFSISGSVDVDQNQYRDLVIGAFDSQSVFVLRAIPVAVAKITLNVTIEEIRLETYECYFDDNPINCFDVEVCTEYYGRGLASGFSTKYELKEVIQRNIASRLFFTTPSSSSTIRDVTYAGINMLFCEDVTVYIKNSSIFDDIILSVELQQIPRDSQPIDTNYIIPSQNIDPVISASPSQLRLPIARECGMDDICTYDLILNHINTVYFGLDGSPHSNQMNLSVGAVNIIRIYLDYRNNLNEDAFNSFITFTLPSRYIEQPQVRQDSQIVECSNKNNDTHIIRQCNIQNRLSSTDGTRGIDITFRIRNVVGNEGTIEIPISIQGNPNNTFATAESNTDNNNILVKIPVYASATYSVEWTDATPLYAGNGSSFNGIDASTLGAAVVLSANVQNNGPSVINEAMLDIFIPSLSPETGNYYYIYPTSISVIPSSSSSCDGSALNPQGYNVLQKKRKSVDIPSRERRQTDMNNNNINGTDCSLSPIGCINVKCNLTNIVSGNINIRITGYIDERFFNEKTASYVLKSLIVVNIVPDGITDIITNSNRAIGTITISKVVEVFDSSVPWYLYVGVILAVIGSIIIVVVLSLILYCLGFFRRKKHQSKDDKVGATDDVEQYAPNPFGTTPRAPTANPTDAKEKEETNL